MCISLCNIKGEKRKEENVENNYWIWNLSSDYQNMLNTHWIDLQKLMNNMSHI